MVDVAGQDRIKRKIEARLEQGMFLQDLLRTAGSEVAETQGKFVDLLNATALHVRTVLEANGRILRCPYEPARYWPSVSGRTFGFIDGGVANLDIPSAGPIGIRVGSYVVTPGRDDESRERFTMETSFVDDVFSDRATTFDADYADTTTLLDAARIACEAGAAMRLVTREPGIDAVLMHGPLINPAAPYGLLDLPAFTLSACRKLLSCPDWEATPHDRGFPALMRTLLLELKGTGVPVAGVVERSKSKYAPFVMAVFGELNVAGTVTEEAVARLRENLTNYGLSDTKLLDLVLEEGEYVQAVAVDRQVDADGSDKKWPKAWKEEIREHPDALTTYVKPSDSSQPFRVEAFVDVRDHAGLIALVMHTSRLLPSYGFPVGLDIVDRFAKVPAWMSTGVRSRHSIGLLQAALASGDPRAVTFAKRILTSKGRDWMFRPTA